MKALMLFHLGKIKLVSASSNYYFLLADDIDVKYDVRKDLWTCTCKHSGWRGSKTDEQCYHIKACKKHMKKLEEQDDKNTNS